MSSLKEKVNFYQANYENSNVLLEAKSEVIVKLQNQMEQLHDKVSFYPFMPNSVLSLALLCFRLCYPK